MGRDSLCRCHGKRSFKSVDSRTQMECDRIGWASMPVNTFLPAINAARSAQQRMQSQIAMLQTVEAIRLYGAENGGKLPASLANLPVPAPVDPATGKPFLYEVSGDKAVLTGYRFPGLQESTCFEVCFSQHQMSRCARVFEVYRLWSSRI